MNRPSLPEALAAVRTLLAYVGEDPTREGIADTPRRVVKALAEFTRHRETNVAELLKVGFSAGAYDELIAVTGIEFTSTCEHHLLPFIGEANIAYLPARAEGDSSAFRVVGLSKIPRLVDVMAGRLQLQEQMTVQIADALEEHLKPRGVAVHLVAKHSCAQCRGVRKIGGLMHTTALRGVCREGAVREEALRTLGVGGRIG